MFKPGDYVIPTDLPRSHLSNFFHPVNQPIGIVLSVDKHATNTRRGRLIHYTILQLYGNPYASGLGPTYTFMISAFYKIDKGRCREALERFILSPTPFHAEKVHNLARQYDRYVVKMPEDRLQRVRSFEEALDANAHLSMRQNNTRYTTYERFIQNRTRDIHSLMTLNQFENVCVPSLRL